MEALHHKTSQFTRDVLLHIAQCGTKGVRFELLAAAFPKVSCSRLSSTLQNLRDCGRVICERHPGQRSGTWFARDTAPSACDRDIARMKRARRTDRERPIQFYGAGLRAPRSPSVWAYARHFQEQRP